MLPYERYASNGLRSLCRVQWRLKSKSTLEAFPLVEIMISVNDIEKKTIRSHYQLGTLFYRLLWGPHIHHGLWNSEQSQESPYVAQCQLTDTLADLLYPSRVGVSPPSPTRYRNFCGERCRFD